MAMKIGMRITMYNAISSNMFSSEASFVIRFYKFINGHHHILGAKVLLTPLKPD